MKSSLFLLLASVAPFACAIVLPRTGGEEIAQVAESVFQALKTPATEGPLARFDALPASEIAQVEDAFLKGWSGPRGLRNQIVSLFSKDPGSIPSVLPEDVKSAVTKYFTVSQQDAVVKSIMSSGLTEQQDQLLQAYVAPNSQLSVETYDKLPSIVRQHFTRDLLSTDLTSGQIKNVMGTYTKLDQTPAGFSSAEVSAFSKLSDSVRRTIMKIAILADGSPSALQDALNSITSH